LVFRSDCEAFPLERRTHRPTLPDEPKAALKSVQVDSVLSTFATHFATFYRALLTQRCEFPPEEPHRLPHAADSTPKIAHKNPQLPTEACNGPSAGLGGARRPLHILYEFTMPSLA
jgi:hypothetical protein